jgi:heme A synthase
MEAPLQPGSDGLRLVGGSASREQAEPGRRVAAWLTVLLAGLFCLNTAGGWVRLSGAGVAIPHWPVIELDGGRKTLLPPFTEDGWQAAHQAWAAHQDALRAKISAGEIHGAALGRQPESIDDFRGMFLTEWFHRLLAAGVGLLALACLGTVLADRGLRRLVGWPVGTAVILIAGQAILGAALIGQGTSTRWLFLHQGNAALILGCVLVAVVRLLGSPSERTRASGETLSRRVVLLAAVSTWLMLMLGGLLAASRHHLPAGGLLGLDAGPAWWPIASVATNLLDNASLHHIAHRIGALVVAALVIAGLVIAHRRGAPERARLALGVAGTFVALQAVLGIATGVMPKGEVAVPLAHLFLGHVLFLVLVLAWHDLRRPQDLPAVTGMAPA